MKTNHSIENRANGNSEADWHCWDEHCDRCGNLIFAKEDWIHGKAPDFEERDLCYKCISVELDKRI